MFVICDEVIIYSLLNNLHHFTFKFCKKEHELVCTDDNGEEKEHRIYYLVSSLGLKRSIKWRFEYIRFDRYQMYVRK